MNELVKNAVHPVIAEDVERIVGEDLPWEALRGATVLVAGAGGMAGSCLLHTLLHLNDAKALGIRAVALVRNGNKARVKLGGLLSRRDVVLLEQDVTAPVRFAGPVDAVIHAASPASPGQFASDPVGTIDANALGTANLLRLAVEKGASRFLFLSSGEVYGMAGRGAPLDEDAAGELQSYATRACYPESKRLAETYCAAYADQYGLACRAARIGHMYGPGVDREDGHAYAEFLRCALEGRDIVLRSDGSLERPYTYVSDVVSGLFYILLKGEEPVYNVADETQVVSIGELARIVIESAFERDLCIVCNAPAPAEKTGFLPYRVGLMSSGRLRSLGWRPRVPLREGMGRTVAALAEGQWP